MSNAEPTDLTGVMARVDSDTITRLDTLAEELSKRFLGLKVSRARVVKLAIERGLVVLERESKK